MPPRWLRRTVLAPGVVVLPLLLITSLPLTVVVAAIASRWLPGRWRPLRLLWVLLTFLVVEALTIIATLGLWVASGFGRRVSRDRWQQAHYGLMRWYLDVLLGAAERRLHLRFDLRVDQDHARGLDGRGLGAALDGRGLGAALDRSEVDAHVASRGRPLIVLSRHAGPGDSFLLVHGLLRAGYRPRIVLRAALRWLPSLDIVLHRVPSHFVERGAPPGTGTTAVSALASGLRPGDALVLFPEGKNFTPARRTRSIAKLEQDGAHDDAEEARELRHVLMPRTGGALAALDAAPSSDVLFVAHWGLEDLSGVVDLWRGLPMDRAIEVEAWRVPAEDIPGPRPARIAWLAWWWRRVDAWLVDRHGVDAVPDTVVEAVAKAQQELEDVRLENGSVEVPWPQAPSGGLLAGGLPADGLPVGGTSSGGSSSGGTSSGEASSGEAADVSANPAPDPTPQASSAGAPLPDRGKTPGQERQ